MLEVFIIRSDSPDADVEKTKACFNKLDRRYHRLFNLSSINSFVVEDWYFIIYDDEAIDEELGNVLQMYLDSDFDVITCMKKSNRGDEVVISESPRCFRKGVKIKPGSMQAENDGSLKITKLLDGWILSHAYHKSRTE